MLQKDAPNTIPAESLGLKATNAGVLGESVSVTRSCPTPCNPMDYSLIFNFILFLTSPKFLQLIHKPYNETTNIGNVSSYPRRWK